MKSAVLWFQLSTLNVHFIHDSLIQNTYGESEKMTYVYISDIVSTRSKFLKQSWETLYSLLRA